MGKKYLDGTTIRDLRGNTYGKLTVLEFDYDRYEKDKIRMLNNEVKSKKAHWVCECECKKTVSVSGNHLISGYTTSCRKCYTLEDWCNDNGVNICDIWDYELNNTNPGEIGYGSKDTIWLKCKNDTHPSYEIKTTNFTSINGSGCPVCASKVVIKGVNDIATTPPHLIKYFVNREDAESSTIGTKKKFDIVCEYCNDIKKRRPSNINRYGVCCSCGDSQSYPNKFMLSFLKQFNVDFETEKVFSWAKNKKYDCYIADLKCVIEAHGGQHYIRGFDCSGGGRTLREEQENDRLKEQLAIDNGIQNYVVIDCRVSELELIKQSIMNSNLPKLLHFKEDDIDWSLCDEYATKNLVKDVCDMWMSRRYNTTSEIGKELKLTHATISKYLKQGAKLGWCDYNAKEELTKSLIRNSRIIGDNISKRTAILKDGEVIGEYNSAVELSNISEEMFGVKLLISKISLVANGKKHQYKGFTFRYIED